MLGPGGHPLIFRRILLSSPRGFRHAMLKRSYFQLSARINSGFLALARALTLSAFCDGEVFFSVIMPFLRFVHKHISRQGRLEGLFGALWWIARCWQRFG